jgi:hypothetical protein
MTDFYYSIASMIERSYGVEFVESFLSHLPDNVMYSIDVLSALVKTFTGKKCYKIDSTIVVSVPRSLMFFELDSLIAISKTKVSSVKLLIISDDSAFRDNDGSMIYEPLAFDEHKFLQSIEFPLEVGTENAVESVAVVDLICSQCHLCTNEIRLLCKLVSREIVTCMNYHEWLPNAFELSWSTHVWSILTVSQRSYIRSRIQNTAGVWNHDSFRLLDELGFVDHFAIHKNVVLRRTR